MKRHGEQSTKMRREWKEKKENESEKEKDEVKHGKIRNWLKVNRIYRALPDKEYRITMTEYLILDKKIVV